MTVSAGICAGCTGVIAAAPHVMAGYSAALMKTARSPALVSLRADGTVASMVNVIWGATFPAPAGRKLACDSAGRCIISARQPDGKPILSAFAMDTDGIWQDVSGADGFASMTKRAGVVDVGQGELGIAIQQAGDGAAAWVVLAWDGTRYTPIGCAPDSATPPAKAGLSLDACLS